MSDKLFDEVPVPGKTEYKWGDWRGYAVHDDKNVKGFFGGYRWASNFEPCEIPYEGLIYPSTEHAYQASKVVAGDRMRFLTCTAAESKKLWKECVLVDATPADWDARKLNVMTEILFQKFLRNPKLRENLLATGDKYLEELNHWGDVVWGVDLKKGGDNWLGLLLMKIRTFWQ